MAGSEPRAEPVGSIELEHFPIRQTHAINLIKSPADCETDQYFKPSTYPTTIFSSTFWSNTGSGHRSSNENACGRLVKRTTTTLTVYHATINLTPKP